MDDSVDKMENGIGTPEQETGETAQTLESPHPHEKLMNDYPLREPGEDPVWSVRIVKGWMWFLAFTTGGILLLIVLGFFYD